MKHIGFNKPFFTGKETQYIYEAVQSGKISGNGMFTQRCQIFFENRYGFKKCLLTTSCTDALEMSAMLAGIRPGDEVIIPSFTFVSTALAFVRQGASVIFADSYTDNPNIDAGAIEFLITNRTKAIVAVHYAGVACDMDVIMKLADQYGLLVIEDAAQAIDSFYTGANGVTRALGSIGHLAAFSFHETKNIISGEGGMLAINDDRFLERAEIIWEKGTNRSQFFRGEINKYSWIDIGSSFLPSEITAAFLYAQIENLDFIQDRRKHLWNRYYENLIRYSENLNLPILPDYATNNGHIFYLVLNDSESRTKLINKLRDDNVDAVFHYISLHSSTYYAPRYFGGPLLNSDKFSNCLLRLPMYFELEDDDIKRVCSIIISTHE
ncbi:dTDP-4-amino-4,6-dideoxygalactose transaminase [Dyadobacter sp. CECT 9275]|uniref:dTDP-4-amino-4,6-dideoxygalactose transaminase n=1 Tax=Dyadobacter helix TaxID=2822344 RepID=A0A916JCU1_9BACT|nr:dTDP-4-amino-4,6-dideoxygalactose transaminase [Dyadobacter sp. CECT 9275]CAG4999715.1 dTDP-4-amino-4,6-dideoxygalactose transaminase [Dyadobacter sp. CECT 9275]